MKWVPFMSIFILDQMCMLIKSGVVVVERSFFLHYGAEVTSSQV